ncbi:MAG: hypothetical protein C0467_18690 [Planctomycetaceae bacterium]|nr:hypothetical protein [Planctomycetaceae bacterium]
MDVTTRFRARSASASAIVRESRHGVAGGFHLNTRPANDIARHRVFRKVIAARTSPTTLTNGKGPAVNDQTPYVVDNKWIVFAKTTMEATMRFRNECDANKWPSVRQANVQDVAKLPPLVSLGNRRAA